MARPRKSRGPSTPAEIAVRRREKRVIEIAPADEGGLSPGALSLPVNATVRVQTDFAGRINRIRRQDVFDLFQARGKLGPDAYQAVRRLQDDIAVLHRVVSGGGDITPRVDRSRTADGFSDARLAAGARIEAVLDRAGASSARLLIALCEPAVISGRGSDWREIVVRVTGERLPRRPGRDPAGGLREPGGRLCGRALAPGRYLRSLTATTTTTMSARAMPPTSISLFSSTGRRPGPKRFTRAATPKKRALRVTALAATNCQKVKWARPEAMVSNL